MTIGALERARASFALRSWEDAYCRLASADSGSPLDLDGLDKLGLAAYLSGRD
jgi:hypothetical protein